MKQADWSELLSPKGRHVVDRITSPFLRARMIRCLETCSAALAVVDAFDVSRYELLDLDLPDREVWNAAAPGVRNVVVAVSASLQILRELYPAGPVSVLATADLQQRLETALDGFEHGEPRPRRRDGHDVDSLVESEGDHDRAVASLIAMLTQEILAFGVSLRSPAIVWDRWLLLAELQELKSKCTQGLEAIPAAVLAPYSRSNSSELFPRYLSELDRSRRLRAALVDLSYDIDRLNRCLEDTADQIAAEVWREASQVLAHFAEQPPYRYLWPRDKRSIILFHAFLKSWPSKPDVLTLRRQLEGFARFLDTLRQINRRPELEASDAEHLEAARAILQRGLSEEISLIHIELVHGRDPDLDTWLRHRRRGGELSDEPLIVFVERALKSLEEITHVSRTGRFSSARANFGT